MDDFNENVKWEDENLTLIDFFRDIRPNTYKSRRNSGVRITTNL